MNFVEMTKARQEKVDSRLCVGLDLSAEAAKDFPGWISHTNVICDFVDAVHPFVCSFKPNLAFYESSGPDGMRVLKDVMQHIRAVAPCLPIIGDGKRTDIGATNKEYVAELFGEKAGFEFDAATVNPYFGGTALENFLECKDKGIIVLCRTSNPGAGEFQDLWAGTENPSDKPREMSAEEWLEVLKRDAKPLYQRVANAVAKSWNKNGNCGLVVGATYPKELAKVRDIVGNNTPILIPGIGTQGGDLERTMEANGDGIVIVNVSSAIAGKYKGADYAEVAAAAAMKYRDEINRYRTKGA